MKAHTRLMSLGFLIAAKAFAAVPVGPAPIAEVMTELRRIESASATGGGQVDILRLEYKELARNRPSDPLPRVYIAWCSLPSDDSWNELKSIAAINPDSPWAHLGMGRIYTGWKMRDQAKAEFAQILARDARFFPALSGLGDFARANNDEVGAEKAYRDSLAIADDAWAHAGLGFLFQKQAKLKEAAEEFRKSLNTFPSQPQVLNEIIGLDRTLKDDAALLQDVTRLAELQPKNRNAIRQLADLKFDAGEKEAAAKEYERAVRLGETEKVVLERLAGIYRESKNAEAEERALQLLAAADKKDAGPFLRMSELAFERNEPAVGETHLLAAIERSPALAEPHLRLAKVRQAKGQLYEAIEHFQAAANAPEPSQEAKDEVTKIEAQLKLPKDPAKGSVDAIYAKVAASLKRVFTSRAKGGAYGTLKLRVRVTKDGVVTGVEVVEDTLKDQIVTANGYLMLLKAQFPKQRREPTFEFEFGTPPKAPKGAK